MSKDGAVLTIAGYEALFRDALNYDESRIKTLSASVGSAAFSRQAKAFTTPLQSKSTQLELIYNDLVARHDSLVISGAFSTQIVALICSFGMKSAVFVERTTTSLRYIETRLPQNNLVEFMSIGAMLNAARAGRSAIYLTFPDHRKPDLGGDLLLPFLSQSQYFSHIESAIVVTGRMPLYTTMIDGTKAISLERCPVDDITSLRSGSPHLLSWLSNKMEQFILASPGEILTWPIILSRMPKAIAREKILTLRHVESLIRIAPKGVLAGESRAALLERVIACSNEDQISGG